ncbi:MAG: hypothetical protein GC172_07485 [Phycisphaera sp.]|nr:hypothetical protein [Phycisphaera sp.]
MPASNRGRRIFLLIVAVFVTAMVATVFWSWSVVGGVRGQAATTDARLRDLAWAVLAYADRNDAFPTSEAELRAFAEGGVPDALSQPPLAIGGRVYPMTRSELAPALPEGEEGVERPREVPPSTLDECFAVIEVEWGILRDVQPILRPKGLPTLQGTVPTVGGWLYAMTERIRGEK